MPSWVYDVFKEIPPELIAVAVLIAVVWKLFRIIESERKMTHETINVINANTVALEKLALLVDTLVQRRRRD